MICLRLHHLNLARRPRQRATGSCGSGCCCGDAEENVMHGRDGTRKHSGVAFFVPPTSINSDESTPRLAPLQTIPFHRARWRRSVPVLGLRTTGWDTPLRHATNQGGATDRLRCPAKPGCSAPSSHNRPQWPRCAKDVCAGPCRVACTTEAAKGHAAFEWPRCAAAQAAMPSMNPRSLHGEVVWPKHEQRLWLGAVKAEWKGVVAYQLLKRALLAVGLWRGMQARGLRMNGANTFARRAPGEPVPII